VITSILDAEQPALIKNYFRRVYGNPSLGRGQIEGQEYANALGFDTPKPEQVLTPILERLLAAGYIDAANYFKAVRDDDLRAERQSIAKWEAWRATAATGKCYDERAADNAAAAAADRLEIEIKQRAEELARGRELAARAKCFADARKDLAR
jgi:hypothetical protein